MHNSRMQESKARVSETVIDGRAELACHPATPHQCCLPVSDSSSCVVGTSTAPPGSSDSGMAVAAMLLETAADSLRPRPCVDGELLNGTEVALGVEADTSALSSSCTTAAANKTKAGKRCEQKKRRKKKR